MDPSALRLSRDIVYGSRDISQAICLRYYNMYAIPRFNQLFVATSLKTLKNVSREVSDDEYTRRARSTRGCYNIELSCNEVTVLFVDFITDRARERRKKGKRRIFRVTRSQRLPDPKTFLRNASSSTAVFRSSDGQTRRTTTFMNFKRLGPHGRTFS